MIGRRVGCQRRQPTLGHRRLLPVLPSPAAGPSRRRHRRPAGTPPHRSATAARRAPAPLSRRCNGDGPGPRVRGLLRLGGAAHHRGRDTSRPAAAAASPPPARGARLRQVARRPIGRWRRRRRPQPAVARHPLDGPQRPPPLRDTAHRTLRRCCAARRARASACSPERTVLQAAHLGSPAGRGRLERPDRCVWSSE